MGKRKKKNKKQRLQEADALRKKIEAQVEQQTSPDSDEADDSTAAAGNMDKEQRTADWHRWKKKRVGRRGSHPA
jgi:hypothetical protein